MNKYLDQTGEKPRINYSIIDIIIFGDAVLNCEKPYTKTNWFWFSETLIVLKEVLNTTHIFLN